MPGPPKKPTALKLLEGNPGQYPLPQNEPQPLKLGRFPNAPKRFSPEAVTEWKRTGPVLFKCGLITNADLPMFEAYCEAWGGYIIAMASGAETPLVEGQKGNLVRNPAVQIARDNLDKAMILAREFGMTPASRTRIELPAGAVPAASGLEAHLA